MVARHFGWTQGTHMFQSVHNIVRNVATTISYYRAAARQEPRAVALTEELVRWYGQELDTLIATTGDLRPLRSKIVFLQRSHLLGKRFQGLCRARIRAEYGGEGE